MTRLRLAMRRFLRGEAGGLSVEAALVFPLLLWAHMAMFVYWDAWKTQSVNLKAAYTLGDMISRETGAIDQPYVDGMNAIYDWLTSSAAPTRLRVSVVTMKLGEDSSRSFRLLWSAGAGGATGHASLAPLLPHLPQTGIGDQLVVVETFMDYAPPFRAGIEPQVFADIVVTRPRFVPQVLWRGAGA